MPDTQPRQLAKIIADSISPHGVRLTTMEIVIPRIVLAEFNTHRALLPDGELFAPFSRNSASSRAIPIEKMLARVAEDPYMPAVFDRNGSGMQGHGELDNTDNEAAQAEWLAARDDAMDRAKQLLALGVHKQWANRVLEPFMWHTVIVTATEWSNFMHLRCHPAAHPAIRDTAEAMSTAMGASTPARLEFGQWHLPYTDERDDGLATRDKIKLSVARCARVSYLTHDGKRDPQADLDLYDRLLALGHMSCFEHVARPMSVHDIEARMREYGGVMIFDRTELDPREHFSGNFRGWVQHRKTIAGEHDILGERGDA